MRIGAFKQGPLRTALSRVLCRTLYLTRQMRLSYLPPLMVYLAAGVSGLTGIVGTFFIKDFLDLPAEFLAMLGFWVGLPWALKMGLGHLVDLIWKWKSLLVFLGATLIAASLTIMLILITSPSLLYTSPTSMKSWFVLAAMLSPIGYVLQDVVADAMTVEAVPTMDEVGNPLDPSVMKSMHTTMQTLGRAAIVGGGIVVSLINIFMFSDVEGLSEGAKKLVYADIYRMALLVPLISVLGVVLAEVLKRWPTPTVGFRLSRLHPPSSPAAVRPNWYILGGSLGFIVFTLVMGLT